MGRGGRKTPARPAKWPKWSPRPRYVFGRLYRSATAVASAREHFDGWELVCAPVPVDGMGFGIVSGDTMIISVSKSEVPAQPQPGDTVELVHGNFGDPRIYELWVNGTRIR